MNTICSMTTIVGRPNAGKSSFMNTLLGQKISIVTAKIQTTRTLIRGILTEDNLQAIFIDTPGIFTPSKKLETSIVKTAWTGLDEGIDFCLHLFDGIKGITEEDLSIIESLKRKKNTIILAAINKIDRLSEKQILDFAQTVYDLSVYKEVFLFSARKNIGIDKFVNYLKKNSPESPWLYDADEVTTLPSRLISSEITREKLFLCLNQELPYNLTVETENWEEDKKAIKINQVIYVTKENYKKIILGEKGQNIKKIGQMARKEIAEVFDKKIHLYLFVKVRENWIDNPYIYQYMGMEMPD
jgi:GTPase